MAAMTPSIAAGGRHSNQRHNDEPHTLVLGGVCAAVRSWNQCVIQLSGGVHHARPFGSFGLHSGNYPGRRYAFRFARRGGDMPQTQGDSHGQYAARHSVSREPMGRQVQWSIVNIGHLGIALLRDKRLRRSALGIAVLAGLLMYGAGEAATEVPLRTLADDLGSSYDAVYKRTQRLAEWGYVQIARGKRGQRRLALRVVWPAWPEPEPPTPGGGASS